MTTEEAWAAFDAEMERCTCTTNPSDYEGPEIDCPEHGKRGVAAVFYLSTHPEVARALLEFNGGDRPWVVNRLRHVNAEVSRMLEEIVQAIGGAQ